MDVPLGRHTWMPLAKMYRNIRAMVRTATEESDYWNMYPGLRQGGRFSTTGAEENYEGIPET